MSKPKRWSQHVTESSHGLDLESGVFSKKRPSDIARSLKRSAEKSKHRKSDAYRSAMSMLSFYINRAGRNLPEDRRTRLEDAKDHLRRLFGRASSSQRKKTPQEPIVRKGSSGRSGTMPRMPSRKE